MGRKGEVNDAPATDPSLPLTARELSDLMRSRGEEAMQIITDKYGGVLEICKKLKTSPNEGMAIWVCVCDADDCASNTFAVFANTSLLPLLAQLSPLSVCVSLQV